MIEKDAVRVKQLKIKVSGLFRETLISFRADRVPRMAGALAYSTLFALPGVLIVVLWLSSFFYSPSFMQSTVALQLNILLGQEISDHVSEMLTHAKFDYTSSWVKILGVVALIFSATSVFREIQDSINTIWSLQTKPKTGILKIIINRLLSFSIIIALGSLLVISLIANALIAALSDRIQLYFPAIPVETYYLLNQLLMIGVLILLFGTIFKVLPDAKIAWRDVLLSAIVTTALFMTGKFGVEYVLKTTTTISFYGSAGAVIVILLWVYYSSIILYLGAEITQVWLKMKGRRIQPNKYAVRVEKQLVKVESKTDIGNTTDARPPTRGKMA